MARLLFAAHDPGGALMIGAAAAELIGRGHEIVFVGAGPAVDVWRRDGYEVTALDVADDPVGAMDVAADAVIAGTGFSGFERRVYRCAGTMGMRCMAAVDAWIHMKPRFEPTEDAAYPDVVAVIDDTAAATFSAEVGEAGAGVELVVVGQPHLEAQTARLLEARGRVRATAEGPVLVFFSEPIIEDFGRDARGYDQFEMFEAAFRALSGAVPQKARFIVKPHPREDMPRWREVARRFADDTGIEVNVADATAEALLAEAVAAVGMTSMVMLEAHLAGMPSLSLQLNRVSAANPVVDETARVVTDAARLPAAVDGFLEDLDSKRPVHSRFRDALEGAIGRFADAVEKRVLC